MSSGNWDILGKVAWSLREASSGDNSSLADKLVWIMEQCGLVKVVENFETFSDDIINMADFELQGNVFQS